MDSADSGARSTPAFRPSTFPSSRGGDTLLEDGGRRLPEGMGADGVALRASSRKRPGEWLAEQCRLARSPGLPGGPPDRAAHPGEPPRPTRGAGEPPRPTRDADAVVWGERDGCSRAPRQAVGRPLRTVPRPLPDCGPCTHSSAPTASGGPRRFLLGRVHRDRWRRVETRGTLESSSLVGRRITDVRA